MVLTMDRGHIDVAMQIAREITRRETHFPARVAGCTPDGRAFDEETVVSNMSVQGAFIHLHHTPKLQSTLQVTINGLGGANGNQPLVLRGYVVRLESTPGANGIGVGILFIE